MNRRNFMALLAGGVGIVAAAPVRRYWQVGALLVPAAPVPSHIAEMAQAMRDALPTTFPVDPRFAKTLSADDIRRMAEQLQAQNAPPHADGCYHVHLHPARAEQLRDALDRNMAQAVADGYLEGYEMGPAGLVSVRPVKPLESIVIRTEIVGPA